MALQATTPGQFRQAWLGHLAAMALRPLPRGSSARPGLTIWPRWRSGQYPGTALDHLAGDDRALHLARPLPDPLHPQLAVEPHGHVLPHVATAAEYLDGTVRDPPGHL